MSLSPADSTIFAPLFSDPDLARIFSDEQFVRNLLEVERTLAQVQGKLGVIPKEAAGEIESAATALEVDFERLRAGTEKDGFPIIELVRQLRHHLKPESADYVHWGATTQDIMDTALVLQMRAALGVIENTLEQVIKNLAALADRHRRTLMAGRTHAQQALPITFGFKVANWLAPLLRHRGRLVELKPRLLVAQFGGAVGTLAALGDKGIQVQEALAEELRLGVLPMPWHTQRDTLVEAANWLSLVSGGLAKMAQDILLLAQTEIGEVRESDDPWRGGSSTMPQKENPMVSEVIIAVARANASLLASMHHALIQEHERATHGWQMEWLALPQMFGHTSVALKKALFLSENLVVDGARMQENVRASHGLMLAEAVSFVLAKSMRRAEAKRVVGEACRIAALQGRHLLEVVQEKVSAPVDWTALNNEVDYLGSTEAFIDRMVGKSAE